LFVGFIERPIHQIDKGMGVRGARPNLPLVLGAETLPEHGHERVLVADDVDYYRRCREVFIKPPEMKTNGNEPRTGCLSRRSSSLSWLLLFPCSFTEVMLSRSAVRAGGPMIRA
jgi:hypothetical protein